MRDPRLYGLFVPFSNDSPNIDSDRLIAVLEVMPRRMPPAGTDLERAYSAETMAYVERNVADDEAFIDSLLAHIALAPAIVARPDGGRVSVRPIDRVTHTVTLYVDEQVQEDALEAASCAAEIQWNEPADDDPYFYAYGMDSDLVVTNNVTPSPSRQEG